MSEYKRWFHLQSENYMKSLKQIEKLEDENRLLTESLEEFVCELSDEDLEMVIGGMSEDRLKIYMTDLINEHRYSLIKS